MFQATPAGEEFLELFIFGLKLRHMARRRHDRRPGRSFRLSIGVIRGLWHEVGQIRLYSTQALNVFIRSHLVRLALIAQLHQLRTTNSAAMALCLQPIHLLQEFHVDFKEQTYALLLSTLAAG